MRFRSSAALRLKYKASQESEDVAYRAMILNTGVAIENSKRKVEFVAVRSLIKIIATVISSKILSPLAIFLISSSFVMPYVRGLDRPTGCTQ